MASPVQYHSSLGSYIVRRTLPPRQLTDERLKELIQIFGGKIEGDTHLQDACYYLVLEACKTRQWEIIEKNNDDISLLRDRWFGMPILHYFIDVGDTGTAQKLIERRIAIHALDQWGASYQDYALRNIEYAKSI
ncbi:MAG: hypothetical protein KR126chlam3_00246 [Chlamydiae bacterium]|nr:hypothetical protein [Chlamydiota bacterium]